MAGRLSVQVLSYNRTDGLLRLVTGGYNSNARMLSSCFSASPGSTNRPIDPQMSKEWNYRDLIYFWPRRALGPFPDYEISMDITSPESQDCGQRRHTGFGQ